MRDPFERLQKGYNPDEPRDERGRWTTGGNSASAAEGDATDAQGGAGEDSIAGNNTVPESWGNPRFFQRHFDKHGADFNATSPEDYASKAQDFYTQGLEEKLPSIEYPNGGEIGIYDPVTNSFGVYNPNGTTTTYYKPTNGLQYYIDEVEDVISNGGKVINELPKDISTAPPVGGGGGGGGPPAIYGGPNKLRTKPDDILN